MTPAIECMSAWKWQQVYLLSLLHGVGHIAWQGVLRLQGQFAMQLSDKLCHQWQQLKPPASVPPTEDKKLQRLLDEMGYTTPAYELLKLQHAVARHFLSDGLFLHDLIAMGQYLRQHADDIDYRLLLQWQRRIGLDHVVEFQNQLLVSLFGFTADELLPQETSADKPLLRHVVNDLSDLSRPRSTQWYFEQGNDVFLHASNSAAMLWQARRSVHYFRYCPTVSIASIFSSFVRSLSQIEE